jgi:hypothetical protein
LRKTPSAILNSINLGGASAFGLQGLLNAQTPRPVGKFHPGELEF